MRDRKGDLGELIDVLLARANDAGEKEEPGYVRKELSVGARRVLLQHSWRGNVRELENALVRLTVWSAGLKITEEEARDALLAAPPPPTARGTGAPDLGDGISLDEELSRIQRELIEGALLADFADDARIEQQPHPGSMTGGGRNLIRSMSATSQYGSSPGSSRAHRSSIARTRACWSVRSRTSAGNSGRGFG